MTKGEIIGQYKSMSAQDQRTFERWLKANVVIGSAISAGLLFMAFGGPALVTPNSAVADGKPIVESTVPVPGRAMSPFDLMIRIQPDALPVEQVAEPF